MAKKPLHKKKVINGKKFRKALYELMPYADIYHDNEGQVVIYTGLTEAKGDKYKQIDW
jgi:hypothetical protein